MPAGLDKFDQMYGPQGRRLAAFAFALLFFVWALSTTRWHTSSSSPSSFRAPLGLGCSSPSLLASRNNASFWRIESSAPASLTIRPADNATYYNCPDLALAAFTVRLHYSNGETHLVRAESRQDTGAIGVYTFDTLPQPLAGSQGTLSAEVEARLEFGFFPGQAAGAPCAEITCVPGILRMIGMEWSGEEIFKSSGERVRIHQAPSELYAIAEGEALPTCTTFDPLPAVVLSNSSSFLFIDPLGAPCDLLKPTALPSTTASPAPIRWIHLVGDSNVRHLVNHLSKPLGLSTCSSHTAEGEKYPTTWLCHDHSGGGLVVTFSWWFLTTDQDDVKNLDNINLTTLGDFLNSIPFDTKSWPPKRIFPDTFDSKTAPVKMSHLFISLGSHAPFITSIGLGPALERLRPALARKVAQASHTSFFTTTAADPAQIPETYGPQALLRNSIMIDMLARGGRGLAKELGAGFLDVFSLSKTIPRSLTVDSVHFQPVVYDAWAELAYTAWRAGKRRGGPERAMLEE